MDMKTFASSDDDRLMPITGTGLPCGLHIKRTGHNPPHGPSADWWVLATANAAGTNGLTCLPKKELEVINFGHSFYA
jgi:hypothetical protein